MTEALDDLDGHPATRNPRIDLALDQLREEVRWYDRAVASFNEHLENHRDRRDLDDLPFREPITENEEYEAVLAGEPAAIETLLHALLREAHLDSRVRRHPRTYPIHEEAVDHLAVARDEVVSTLEGVLLEIHMGAE